MTAFPSSFFRLARDFPTRSIQSPSSVCFTCSGLPTKTKSISWGKSASLLNSAQSYSVKFIPLTLLLHPRLP